jgi:hypothetical protein
MELVKTEPLKTEYRCLFSLYQKTRLPGQRERIMPGVDFNVLRTEITMEQVLNNLASSPRIDPETNCTDLARFTVRRPAAVERVR